MGIFPYIKNNEENAREIFTIVLFIIILTLVFKLIYILYKKITKTHKIMKTLLTISFMLILSCTIFAQDNEEFGVLKTDEGIFLVEKIEKIEISEELFSKHNGKNVVEAWNKGSSKLTECSDNYYDKWGFKKQRYAKSFYLIRKNDKIEEDSVSIPIGIPKTAWETPIFYIIAFLFGFFWRKKNKNTNNVIFIISSIFTGIFITQYFPTFIPIIIYSLLILFGLLVRYLLRRSQIQS